MRKRKAFLGVGLACALLLTMLAGCGAQESSAAPTSEASVKTEQTESQSGNVFTNPDVSIGEGTITVLTNVTERQSPEGIGEIRSGVRCEISRYSEGGIRGHR